MIVLKKTLKNRDWNHSRQEVGCVYMCVCVCVCVSSMKLLVSKEFVNLSFDNIIVY